MSGSFSCEVSQPSHIEKQELTIERSVIFGKYIELSFFFLDHRIEYVFKELKGKGGPFLLGGIVT